MHRSRLAGFIIDAQGGDLPSAAAFWSRALGARRVQKGARWWVMEAPTGHRFCAVRPQRRNFERTAHVWP